jgi:LmbE family N-acetylglucosaminyl deacetylase
MAGYCFFVLGAGHKRRIAVCSDGEMGQNQKIRQLELAHTKRTRAHPSHNPNL